MILAVSTPAALAVAGAILLLALLVRLFGRWLIRKGSSMEAARHGVLPGAGSDPTKQGRAARDETASPPEPERYDPFNVD